MNTEWDIESVSSMIESAFLPPSALRQGFDGEERAASYLLDQIIVLLSADGLFSAARRLDSARVVFTISDMPTSFVTNGPEGPMIFIDRGILGCLDHMSQFLSFFWAVDPTAPWRVSRPGKPRDELIEQAYRSYFTGLRLAGNYVQRFRSCPARDSESFYLLVRFWSFAFILVHEAAHIVLDEESESLPDKTRETRADRWALNMAGRLARSTGLAPDGAFPLLGSMIYLLSTGESEEALYLHTPVSHPSGFERLETLASWATNRSNPAPDELLWVSDVLSPLMDISNSLASDPVPLEKTLVYAKAMFTIPYFSPASGLSSDLAAALMIRDAGFYSKAMEPSVSKIQGIGRALSQRASDEDSLALGRQWCAAHIRPVAEHQMRQVATGSGVGFRESFELLKEALMPLPTSVYPLVAGLLWSALGWQARRPIR